jgi:acetyl esterase/lipase
LETLYHTSSEMKSPFNTVKLPRPAGLLLVSPYTGDIDSEETVKAQANLSHDYISQATKAKMIEYLPENSQAQAFSYLSKDVSIAQFLPRNICIAVGGKEVLLDSGLQFAKRCREENLQVTLVREEMVHDWFMLGYLFTSDPNVIKRAVSTVVDLAQGAVDRQKIQN